MSQEIETIKLKKLKKGDKIKVKGKEYEVEGFKDVHSDRENKKIDAKEVVLKKISKEGQGHLKGKYISMYNKKTNEAKLYKGIEEKEVSPNEFKFTSKKVFFSHQKMNNDRGDEDGQ